jgi:hypothetical protein
MHQFVNLTIQEQVVDLVILVLPPVAEVLTTAPDASIVGSANPTRTDMLNARIAHPYRHHVLRFRLVQVLPPRAE